MSRLASDWRRSHSRAMPIVSSSLGHVISGCACRTRSRALHNAAAQIRRGPELGRPHQRGTIRSRSNPSRAIGPSRLLLAAIAALSDAEGQVDGITAGELRELAGVAESTYRRARKSLIGSGELELVRGVG